MEKRMGKLSIANLDSVQITALLPLWARALETKKRNPILVDPTAVEIVECVDFDFEKAAKGIPEIVQLSWIARCKRFDEIVRSFVREHPRGTVVNIGCGLDTTYERVGSGSALWYDLDLPGLIELRRNFLKESEKREFIAASFLETGWLEALKGKGPFLFIASNVFFYFEEPQIRGFFRRIGVELGGAELFFDVASDIGVRFGNRFLLRTGMGSDACFRWGMNDASDILAWNEGADVLGVYSPFGIGGLNLRPKERILAFLSDKSRNTYMVHARIGGRDA
jgi:O-methyltransferase involved in polyketide biosynthesis